MFRRLFFFSVWLSGMVACGVCAADADWPQFRGPGHNNVAASERGLMRKWPAGKPQVVWEKTLLTPGYSGAAIHEGLVYLMDYDPKKGVDVVLCLSLADGKEIWQYSYPSPMPENNGYSRTVPAANSQYVVTIGPRCHVTCLQAKTGNLVWQ